jgi:hypothetical protein
MRPIVLAFCSDGPYHYLRQLVAGNSHAWFPWGYQTKFVDPALLAALTTGQSVEIWEIDDTRRPTHAEPLVAASIDHLVKTDGYLAMTLQCRQTEPGARADQVLSGVHDGKLAFFAELARQDAGVEASRSVPVR